MNQQSPAPGGTAPLGARTVARVGYGAMQLERLRADRPAAVALLRRARELGVNHVDTAQFYGFGHVNEMIREAFGDAGDVVVVSKVGADPEPEGPVPLRLAQRPGELRASVEDNLRTLGRERIDVVNLRRADTGPGLRAEGDQIVPLDDQLAVMTALRDEGKIGGIGLSSVTAEVLRQALPAGIVCVQNAYSLVGRDAEDVLAVCAAEGIAWVPYFPLGGAFPGLPKVSEEAAAVRIADDLGATVSQVGLAWLLHHHPGTLLIPGTASVAHLEENTAAGSLVLDEAAMAALDAVESRSSDVRIG
ncbi:aldo/keto reductase [Streptomyces sp. NRRL F-5630]|uniref:aldo/keto reductase n=1 Tax=Streptomyces sp. NRRL F-5630 TaxID=1463864 RepID=UPI003D74FEEA